MYARAGNDWVYHPLAADSLLQMPEIGIELPLAELYEGIDLTSGEPDETSAPSALG